MSTNETETAAIEQPKKPKRATFVQPTPTAEELAELEEKHGDVLHLKSDSEMSPWAVIVRRPTRPETMKFKADSRKDGNQAVLAPEAFIRAIAVWPKSHVMDEMVAKWSMFPDGICVSPIFREFVGLQVGSDLKG